MTLGMNFHFSETIVRFEFALIDHGILSIGIWPGGAVCPAQEEFWTERKNHLHSTELRLKADALCGGGQRETEGSAKEHGLGFTDVGNDGAVKDLRLQ